MNQCGRIPVVQERTSIYGWETSEHKGIETCVDRRARHSIISGAVFVYAAEDKAGMKAWGGYVS